jgi:hypothetical protein
MEDTKLFMNLVRREYPDTKFGTSDISEKVNTFLGNQFKLKFFSMKKRDTFPYPQTIQPIILYLPPLSVRGQNPNQNLGHIPLY